MSFRTVLHSLRSFPLPFSCAMIGQSILNVHAGGRYRVSTFISGFFTLIMLMPPTRT